MIYIRDLKNSTRKPLERKSKFSNVAGYRSNLHRSRGVLYSKNKHMEKEITDTLTIASKKTGINPTRENGTSTLKTLKKQTKTIENGKTAYVYGLLEIIF